MFFAPNLYPSLQVCDLSFEDDVEVEAAEAPKRRRESEQVELQSALLSSINNLSQVMASNVAAQVEALKKHEEQQKKIMETVKKTLGQVQQMRNGPRTDNQQMPRSQHTGGSTGTRPIFNLPLSRLSLAEKMALICKDYNAQCADSEVS